MADEIDKKIKKNWKPNSALLKRLLLSILQFPFKIFTGLNAHI